MTYSSWKDMLEGCDYRHIYICPLPKGHMGAHSPTEQIEAYATHVWSIERDLKQAVEKVQELEKTIEDLLRGGDHEGECTNEFEAGPCTLHVDASAKREENAKRILGWFDEHNC